MADEKTKTETIDEVVEKLAEKTGRIRYAADVGVGILKGKNKKAYIDFKAFGWKYKHLMAYESAVGARQLALTIIERIQDWNVFTEEGDPVPFQPFALDDDQKIVEGEYDEMVIGELEPDVISWIVAGWRWAYNMAGTPDPNS